MVFAVSAPAGAGPGEEEVAPRRQFRQIRFGNLFLLSDPDFLDTFFADFWLSEGKRCLSEIRSDRVIPRAKRTLREHKMVLQGYSVS